MAEPAGSSKLSREARGTLEALRHEFERCSSQYPPLYHELWQPHVSLAEYDLDKVCDSFRKAFAEELGDGWQKWDIPDEVGIDHFGRYFGNGDGYKEFETLADNAG